jgi:hypothetical protein
MVQSITDDMVVVENEEIGVHNQYFLSEQYSTDALGQKVIISDFVIPQELLHLEV